MAPLSVLESLSQKVAAAVSQTSPGPLRRAACLGVATAFLGGLAWVDRFTAHGLNLAVLYVIPALAVAATVGLGCSILVAAEGAVAWALGEPGVHGQVSSSVHAVDACIRFVGVVTAAVVVEALRRATRRAVDSDQRSRELMALVSHQLRTPVAGLRASAETLVSMGAGREQEPFLADIAREAVRVGRLLNNLLWVARIEGGALYPTRPCDPRSACVSEAERVERRRADLSITIDGDPGPMVLAEDVLREVVANLLDNASRHARSSVHVRLRARPDELSVQVADDGPGLPPGREQDAFLRFVSFDGGTGLGLSLSRGAARAAGGDLLYGAGSFELLLPARPSIEVTAHHDHGLRIPA